MAMDVGMFIYHNHGTSNNFLTKETLACYPSVNNKESPLYLGAAMYEVFRGGYSTQFHIFKEWSCDFYARQVTCKSENLLLLQFCDFIYLFIFKIAWKKTSCKRKNVLQYIGAFVKLPTISVWALWRVMETHLEMLLLANRTNKSQFIKIDTELYSFGSDTNLPNKKLCWSLCCHVFFQMIILNSHPCCVWTNGNISIPAISGRPGRRWIPSAVHNYMRSWKRLQ